MRRAGLRLTQQDEAIIRRSWNTDKSWPVPQLLAEIDRLRAALSDDGALDVETLAEAMCDGSPDGEPAVGGIPWKYRNEGERLLRVADARIVAAEYDRIRRVARQSGGQEG